MNRLHRSSLEPSWEPWTKSVKDALGVGSQRGFEWSSLAGRAVVMAVTLGMSWILSGLMFGVWTGWGTVYEESLFAATQAGEVENERLGEGVRYQRSWRDDALEFKVYVPVSGREALVTSLWAGRLQALGRDWSGTECGDGAAARRIGYGFAWMHHGDAREGVVRLGGRAAVTNCRVLVFFEPSPGWAPFARDAVMEIPRGALTPLIGMILQEATEGVSQGGETVEFGGAVADGMTRRIASSVTQGLEYERLEKGLERIALMYGPIQFLSVGMAFVSVILLVASLWSWWARASVEIAMNLIPYIGFFGTLMGMGGALAVLGEANLSDPVSKAISLGPIGSRLALAIETTKWALICYGVVSVLVLVRDSVFKRGGMSDEGAKVHRMQ